MHASVELITFDLGNVMIYLAGPWENACRLAGVDYRNAVITDEIRRAWQQLECEVESGRISMSEHYARLAAIFQGHFSLDEIVRSYQAVIREEIPGIFDIVMALKHTGYRTACLSNTCAAHWKDMTNPARYPAIGTLDYRHASHLFGVLKPDPLIYRKFEAATGCSPERILFFDDRQENVLAARKCGWQAVQINNAETSVAQITAALARFGISVPAVRG